MRKKLFILVFILLNSFHLFADDTLYGLIGNSLIPIGEKNTDIQMKEETVKLTLYDDYFEIDVEFIFDNYGPEQELIVGFPVTYATDLGKIYDFRSWTDGIECERKFLPIEQDDSDYVVETEMESSRDWYGYKADNAYVIPIIFKKGITKTRINYKSIYRLGTMEYDEYKKVYMVRSIDNLYYYYGSARVWKGDIEKVNVIVTNKSSNYFGRIDYHRIPQWIDDNVFTYTITNVKAEISSFLKWCIGSFNDTSYSYLEDFISERKRFERYDADYSKKYFKELLQNLNKNQLRFLRNAFYAVHGYKFKSEDLNIIFSNCSWYKINPEYSDSLLTDLDKEFISMVQEEESTRNY